MYGLRSSEGGEVLDLMEANGIHVVESFPINRVLFVYIVYIMTPDAGYGYLATAALRGGVFRWYHANVSTAVAFTKADRLAFCIDLENVDVEIVYPSALFACSFTAGRAMTGPALTLTVTSRGMGDVEFAMTYDIYSLRKVANMGFGLDNDLFDTTWRTWRSSSRTRTRWSTAASPMAAP